MWSQLLAEILQCNWVNYSLPGLGNEAIAGLVLDELEFCDDPQSLWIIQWTAPRRVDVEINAHNKWVEDLASTDPVYYKNYIQSKKGRRWWSSSASTVDAVQNHKKMISSSQLSAQSLLQALAVRQALEHKNMHWKYMFTYRPDWINSKFMPMQQIVFPSLEEFRHQSQYQELDIREIQPVSSIHLEFLELYILPELEYNVTNFEKIKRKTIATDQRRRQDLDKQLLTNRP